MRKPNSKSGGFTLIEIMVTVAILAIVATVAIPSYQRQSLKSKRADGIAMLMDAAAKQERYSIDNNGLYTADMTLLGYSASPVPSEKGYYKISAVLAGGGFTLTATAQAGQSDDECKNLTLNNTGTRDWTGTNAGPPVTKVANCW